MLLSAKHKRGRTWNLNFLKNTNLSIFLIFVLCWSPRSECMSSLGLWEDDKLMMEKVSDSDACLSLLMMENSRLCLDGEWAGVNQAEQGATAATSTILGQSCISSNSDWCLVLLCRNFISFEGEYFNLFKLVLQHLVVHRTDRHWTQSPLQPS